MITRAEYDMKACGMTPGQIREQIEILLRALP